MPKKEGSSDFFSLLPGKSTDSVVLLDNLHERKRSQTESTIIRHDTPTNVLLSPISPIKRSTPESYVNGDSDSNIDLAALELDDDDEQADGASRRFDGASSFDSQDALKGYNEGDSSSILENNRSHSANSENYIFRKTGTFGTALSSLDFLPVASQSNLGQKDVQDYYNEDFNDTVEADDEDEDDDVVDFG
ncbi:unnamed protein product [Ambrosiozyma monospora]|uniref:Unnamed protein product n=1 Tax=Ambrosiozyma monospora TaxID=43982 RepID=A0ACB5TCM1_AMBMO|nr:unnamed protein product [Ambrosiozyma monospora]